MAETVGEMVEEGSTCKSSLWAQKHNDVISLNVDWLVLGNRQSISFYAPHVSHQALMDEHGATKQSGLVVFVQNAWYADKNKTKQNKTAFYYMQILFQTATSTPALPFPHHQHSCHRAGVTYHWLPSWMCRRTCQWHLSLSGLSHEIRSGPYTFYRLGLHKVLFI